jgi:assimilatory nitrate reductase catalytic subunit
VRKAVSSGTACTVADLGRTLRAGTNCGSCLPELKRMLVHDRIQ